jgi:hydroxylaminobenzene mutase
MPADSLKRPLLRHGAILFLLGLVTAIPNQAYANPRVGLSAHIAGVMSGLFLLVLGAIWSELRLSTAAKAWTYWLALSNYLGWIGLVFAAAWGTGRVTPINGAGTEAAAWQDAVVFVVLAIFSLASLGNIALVIYGLRGEDT